MEAKMQEHDTAHRHDHQGCEENLMATNITVTLTPGNPKANKEVPCGIQIAPKKYDAEGVIWLSPNEEYNIMFNLPAAGPRSWDTGGPFCNRKSDCPTAADGTNDGFTISAKGASSITVNVPKQNPKTVQHYRMNFDSSYFCDPIIVVGDV
jgi:hypothetical protein